jgi:tRNA(Arg) A34 adenosine deaminase TadA
MALVHSRIRRLIFWRGTKNGARELGWMKGDEEDPTLNHRYLCFERVDGALEEANDVAELENDVYA